MLWAPWYGNTILYRGYTENGTRIEDRIKFGPTQYLPSKEPTKFRSFDGGYLNAIKFQKMLFLFNSIEQGWTVKKRGDSFVFIKSHEGKKEVLEDAYLKKFMKSNLDLSKIIS